MEKASFFYDFYGFGGIRSTQPTTLKTDNSGSFSFKNLSDYSEFERPFSISGAVTNRSYRAWSLKI